MILNRVQQKSSFGPPSLTFWMKRIRNLLNSCKEQNQEADRLSNMGCYCLPGKLFYQAHKNGSIYSSGVSISNGLYRTVLCNLAVFFCNCPYLSCLFHIFKMNI